MAFSSDLVVRNANVLTVNRAQPRAQAFAVHDGRFIAVGHNDDVDDVIGPNTRIVDLEGLTVIPGFIDAHIHVLSSGVRHVQEVDCAKGDISSILVALRERANQTRPGQWVQGFKFDDTKTVESRMLLREDLDEVSTEHPILVAHRGSHLFFLNSRGLGAAGFTRESPDPPGGRLGRNPGTGELTGIIYERGAIQVVRKLLPAVTEEIRDAGLETICDMLAESGLTSVHDARVSADDMQTYQKARSNGELKLRVYMLMSVDYFPEIFQGLRDSGIGTGFGDDMLRLGGMKLGIDGAIAGRTAHISEPYVGSDNDHGISTMSSEELESKVLEMHRLGYQLCVHANGDLAIDKTLTAFEKAQQSFPRSNARHRIEHCTVVNPDLLRRIQAQACVVTPFCTYVYYHGEKMRFYGEDRVKWMFAQRSFIDYGIVSTGATDYPPGPFEPLLGIQSCVTRTDMAGHVWGKNQAVSVEEALRLYTLNSAYASFEEDLKGSIEAGKLGDFVVLGADPTEVDPNTIKDIPVIRTVVGGRTVHEAAGYAE